MIYISGAIVWLVLCALVATIAERKGRKGGGYLLLSIFLSPLVGGIIVLCVSDKTKKECPFCKKAIDKNATVCPYCNQTIVKKPSSEKEKWISQRIIELINGGKSATDAKIQAEAEYSVKQTNSESQS